MLTTSELIQLVLNEIVEFCGYAQSVNDPR